MQVVSDDVIELLSQTRVIFQDPAETTPTVPAEVRGQRPGVFAQFRHVTAGTRQSSVRITPAAVDGNFWSAQWEEPLVLMNDSAALDI